MSYNELYSRVTSSPEATNVLDFASTQRRGDAQVGYSTSARSIGLSTPGKNFAGNNGVVQQQQQQQLADSFKAKNKSLYQPSVRCIRANCGNEGTRVVARTEIPFLMQIWGIDSRPESDDDLKLCPAHYKEFRDASLKNLHTSRKYDLLPPSMDPPSLYETPVYVQHAESIDMETEEPIQRFDMPEGIYKAVSTIANVIKEPSQKTYLDMIYEFFKKCCYGESEDQPTVNQTNFVQSQQQLNVFGQPVAWMNLPQQQPHVFGQSRATFSPQQPATPFGNHFQPVGMQQLQSPFATPSRQPREPVNQPRNVLSPNSLTREVAPLQHSLASSGMSRRFGAGQTSEFQSKLFTTG
jgi:hypothetical protein